MEKTASGIARFRGFSLESDAFTTIMELIEKDVSTMKKLSTASADMMLGGGIKRSVMVVKPLVQKWMKKNEDKVVDALVSETQALKEVMLIGDRPKVMATLSSIVAKGLVSDIHENMFSYRKFINSDLFEQLEQISVDRGKRTLQIMMEKGDGAYDKRASEDNNMKIASDYIDAYTLEKAEREKGRAERISKEEMPNSKFVLKGIDKKYIYFNVVCRSGKFDESEVEDIVAKTRFIPISVTDTMGMLYIGEFKMKMM